MCRLSSCEEIDVDAVAGSCQESDPKVQVGRCRRSELDDLIVAPVFLQVSQAVHEVAGVGNDGRCVFEASDEGFERFERAAPMRQDVVSVHCPCEEFVRRQRYSERSRADEPPEYDRLFARPAFGLQFVLCKEHGTLDWFIVGQRSIHDMDRQWDRRRGSNAVFRSVEENRDDVVDVTVCLSLWVRRWFERERQCWGERYVCREAFLRWYERLYWASNDARLPCFTQEKVVC